MTNKEAIKFLQQLYPNGGHCWLDEQRIEAIGMAVKALQEEPESIWHDANDEPNNMSHCLVFYGDKSLIGHYLHYEPVLYNKQDKVFVTVAYPHQTGYKVEQKSLDGGCVAEVYKDKRDRISISDITSWCYLNDLHNFTQKEEPAIEDLGDYINELSKQFPEVSFAKLSRIAVRVAKWQKEQTISKACEWLKKNVTFTHPRKGTEECVVNLGKFKEAMKEWCDFINFELNKQEEPVSDDFENALAEEWKGYNDRGAAKVDALEDNTQELAFAKGFYRGWHYNKEKSVSEDLPHIRHRDTLDEFAYQCAYDMSNDWAKETPTWHDVEMACKLGAKWQKDSLWKPADGDDLPEIDREIIALTQPYPLEGNEYAVSFAHRPNPDGWDGKSLTSGKVEHYTPKTYDKGGWNIPDVKYWLDV